MPTGNPVGILLCPSIKDILRFRYNHAAFSIPFHLPAAHLGRPEHENHAGTGTARPGKQLMGKRGEISDRPEAMSIVKDGEWEGMPLHRLWEEHRQEIFGPGYERFPAFPCSAKFWMPAKIFPFRCIPGTHGGSPAGRSKNEIWYVLHASPDALIYGEWRKTPHSRTSVMRRKQDRWSS